MATRRLQVIIAGSAAGAQKAFGEAERSAEGFRGKLANVGRSMTNFGTSMTTRVTLPIVGALGYATKAAADEDKGIQLLHGTLQRNVHATKDQIAAVDAWITKTQNATGVLDDDLRPAMQKLIIAGRSVKQSQHDINVALDISAARGKPLKTVIEAMSKAAKGNVGSFGRLGIATKDASGATLTYDQILKEASRTMGGQAAKAAQTASGRAAIMKAKWDDVVESVGAGLLPVLSMLAGWLGKVADKFNGLSPTAQKFVVIGALLIAAIGPIVTIVGAVASALALLTLPIIAVAAGVAVFAAAWVFAYEKISFFHNAVNAYVAFLINTVWPAVQAVAAGIVTEFSKLVAWVQANWPAIQEAISHVMNVIRDVVNAVLTVVQGYWNTFGSTILSNVTRVWNIIYAVISIAINLIAGIIRVVTAVINGDWGKAWDAIKQTFARVWGAVPGIAANVGHILWSTISAVMAFLGGIVKGGIDKVVGFFRGLPGRLLGIVGSISGAAASVGSAIWNGIVRGLEGAASFVGDLASKLWGAIKGFINAHFIDPVRSFKVSVLGHGFQPFGGLPRLHSGGTFRSPTPGGEGLALLRDGERISTPGRGGDGGVTIVLNNPVIGGPRELADMIKAAVRQGHLPRNWAA